MFTRICRMAVSFYIASQLFSIVSHQISHASSPSKTEAVDCALVDWHVSGFWVINSPVAWLKVTNYGDTPVSHLKLRYETFTEDNKLLDTGTYTIEGTVDAHSTRNFVEQYLGLSSLEAQKLQVSLVSFDQ